MEAAESVTVGTAAASGHRREGSPGAQRGPSSRQHRRLLHPVQRTNADQQPSAATATAASTVHRLHGGLPLDGRCTLPERHLRPQLSALIRARATPKDFWISANSA